MARIGSSSRYLHYRRRKRDGKGKGMPRWRMALMALGAVMVIAVAILAGVGYGVYRSYASDLMPPDEALAALPGGARIYDKNGTLLYEYLNDDYGRREEVDLSEISPYLIDATIAVEDASYWDNPGVNFRGLAAAAIDNLSPFGGAPGFLQGRGGSSITQQLVKNVYFLPDERNDRTIERKLKETVIALELTNKYSKEQILEWYLNLIPFGNLYSGIEAASQGYFGKPAKDLTIGEASLLAGIPVNPSLYDPINNPENARDRQLHVLDRMHEENLIDDDEFEEAAAQPIEVNPTRFPITAPHFVFRVVEPQLDRLFGKDAKHKDGLEVYTTLDLKWQRQAEQILEEQISAYEATGNASGHNGAFVAIEPSTAQILVYVGSRDYFNTDIDGQNDMAGAKNSPGSAFKPFTYLTAFIELGWGPGTWILDSPYTYRDASGSTFTPENPDKRTRGPITIRDALGNSLNIPAVKTIVYAGVPEVIAQAKQMGFTSLDDAGLGPALTVGGGDVRLIDMVYGFTVFPNLGVLKGVETELDLPAGNRSLDPVSILRVEDRSGTALYPLVDDEAVDSLPVQEERVAPAQETYLVTDILVDPEAECIIFGCGRLSIPGGRELAVKTGTSRPYTNTRQTGDTWTMAYTPQIVAGTWFGNADNSPIGSATSTTLSWPIMQEFMTAYHQDLPAERFTRPEDLERAEVCLLSGLKPTPDCPLTTPDDLFAKRSLPEEDDDWWTKVTIDSRTGLLASDLTPDQFMQDRFFLDLPDDLSAFERDQAKQWASRMNAVIDSPPIEETEAEDIPVALTSPADGARIEQRVVIIIGRASSSAFQSYRLEVNANQQPGGWRRINASTTAVTNGTLGVWDARNAAPGQYTIRLTLIDGDLGQIVIQIRIRLVVASQPTPTPVPLPAPTATPVDDGNSGPGGGQGQGPP